MTKNEFDGRVKEIVRLIEALKSALDNDEINLAHESHDYSSSDGWETIRVALHKAKRDHQ